MDKPHDCQIDHFYALSPVIRPRAVMARKQAHEEMLFHEGRMIVRGHIREIKVKHMGVGVYEMTLAPLDAYASPPLDKED